MSNKPMARGYLYTTKWLLPFILLLFLCYGFKGVASETGSSHPSLVDSAFVKQWTKLDSTHIAEYIKQPAFRYQEEEIPLTWWDKFKLWLWDLLRRALNHRETGPLIKWGFILAGAIALVYLMLRLSGVNVMRLFAKENKHQTGSMETDMEDIHEIDFDGQLQLAIQQPDYRLATRLLYLKSLKNLTDARLIEWQSGKTNIAYLKELKENALKPNFSYLTNQFEFIWYGGFSIEREKFDQLRQEFNTFNKQVK